MITGTTPSSFGIRPSIAGTGTVVVAAAAAWGFGAGFFVGFATTGTAFGAGPVHGRASPRFDVGAFGVSASRVYVTPASQSRNSAIPSRRAASICALTSAGP